MNGRIDVAEGLFRSGLLLGAGIFLMESMGTPWSRGFFGVAALLLALVIVTTMLIQWRVLGDWRRGWNMGLAAGLVPVLATPIAAVFSPQLGNSLLPDAVENAIRESLGMLAQLPGFATLGALLSGIISFALLLGAILILALGGARRSRAGVVMLGLLVGMTTLFFYPSVETLVGFALIASFLHVHWDKPLILPDRILESLSPTQDRYLRLLQDSGGVSTGETRLWLDNDPRAFEALLELKLVEYDAIAREVVPGVRLLHDPAAGAMETAFAVARRGAWILLGVVYFIMPDLLPGPLDDLIVMTLTTGIGSELFRFFFGSTTRRR